jgi:hypothetical protein
MELLAKNQVKCARILLLTGAIFLSALGRAQTVSLEERGVKPLFRRKPAPLHP